MNRELAEKIADATLYEGYLLYPYRHSSVKNQRRFNFGVLVPQAYSEAQSPGTENWQMQTECLVLGDQQTMLDVKVRFLHLREREANETSWQEAVEREATPPSLTLSALVTEPRRFPIFFPAVREREFARDATGNNTGEIVRRQEAIEGTVELRIADCGLRIAPERLFKITVRILNQTAIEPAAVKSRDEALLGSFVSTHTILSVSGGEFISLLDPPAEFREAAAGCRNIGAWPVLAGEAGTRDAMLSSPIILYDYPQIAPESAGDLFDGTEIDEILMLRILTLTEEEKREMRDADDRARQILERTETFPEEHFMKLHGALRRLRPAPPLN
jgi:hydrogenase maturation protease